MPEEEKRPVGKVKVTQREVTQRQVIHSGEAARYYTNNTEIGMTSFDISLKFALIEGADNEAVHVKDQAIITMSLHQAKLVARIIDMYVKQFEQEHGPLFVPTVEDLEIERDTVAAKIDSNA